MAFPSNKEVRYLTAISLYPSGGTIFEDEIRSFCIAFPAGGKKLFIILLQVFRVLEKIFKGTVSRDGFRVLEKIFKATVSRDGIGV